MQPTQMPPSQETIGIAESVLSTVFGGRVRLDKGENLQGGIRMQVYRFSMVDAPSKAPASVIVKQVKSTERHLVVCDCQMSTHSTLFKMH